MASSGRKRLASAALLSLLLGSGASGACAQAISTATRTTPGISQEQFLALMARLDALEERNGQLEAQVLDLKGATAAADADLRTTQAATTVSLANARPTFATGDGQFSASLRGMLQLDTAHYDQRRPGPLAGDFRRGSLGDAVEADRARDLSDGANIRRARLGIEGRVWGDWAYSLVYEFGGTGVEEPGRITTVYVEYGGVKPWRFRIGAFPTQSTSFEDATPPTGTLFPERAAPAELVRGLAGGDGRTSLAALGSGERWNATFALTGNVIGAQTFDEQLGFLGRLAFVPWKTDQSLIHLGANTTIVINPAATGPDAPPGAQTPIRLRERPEMRVDGTRLIDTGNLDARHLTTFGLEVGWQRKNLSLQAEHIWIQVERRASALPNPNFTGWYVQGAWTLSGEARRYTMAQGGFDTPRTAKPFKRGTGGLGAWELAARYSNLNLDDRAGAAGVAPDASAVRGGEQDIFTVGLNWYPNENVRFLLDYQNVEVDRLSPGAGAFGAGALTPPAGAQVGQDFNIWSLRTQFAF